MLHAEMWPFSSARIQGHPCCTYTRTMRCILYVSKESNSVWSYFAPCIYIYIPTASFATLCCIVSSRRRIHAIHVLCTFVYACNGFECGYNGTNTWARPIFFSSLFSIHYISLKKNSASLSLARVESTTKSCSGLMVKASDIERMYKVDCLGQM